MNQADSQQCRSACRGQRQRSRDPGAAEAFRAIIIYHDEVEALALESRHGMGEQAGRSLPAVEF